MKIAYITEGNPLDKNSWSGTNFYVRKALLDSGNDVYCISIPKPKKNYKLLQKIFYRIIGKNYIYTRSIDYCNYCASYIKTHIVPNTDIIFALGSFSISQLKINIPIIFYTDGVFSLTSKMYDWCNNMPKTLYDQQDKIEKLALENCSKAIVSSECLIPEILEHYNTNPKKLAIIPFGANLDIIPTDAEISLDIEKRINNKELNILFVGIDWYRKGGNIVLKTTELIASHNVSIKLHLVGCKQVPDSLPNFVVNHGFLSKNNEKTYSELINLYKECHFLFVPSMGECYGLVFCEASAYGLPSISHHIGGIPTIVKDGKNGYLFKIGTDENVFADKILSIFNNKTEYKSLCKNARIEFNNRLNWHVAGKSLSEIINQVHK